MGRAGITISKVLDFRNLAEGKVTDRDNKFSETSMLDRPKHVCHIVCGQAKCSTERQR